MHELTLCKKLIEIILRRAEEIVCCKITKIILEIGVFANVETSSLLFCFDVVTRGTIAEKANLEIIQIQGQARCENCGKTQPVSEFGKNCIQCGSYRLAISSGDELQIKSMEVE